MQSRSVTTSQSNQILNDLKALSSEEFVSLYGIIIHDDNTVYDQAYDQTFNDIEAWIAFSSEDTDNEFEKFGYVDSDYI